MNPNRFELQLNLPRVVFGAGSLEQLPAEIERLGAQRALVLSTPEQAGAARACRRLLGERAAGVFAARGDARADRDRARGARRGAAARRRLRGRDRRRLDHRPRQGDRARLRAADRRHARPPTPAAR